MLSNNGSNIIFLTVMELKYYFAKVVRHFLTPDKSFISIFSRNKIHASSCNTMHSFAGEDLSSDIIRTDMISRRKCSACQLALSYFAGHKTPNIRYIWSVGTYSANFSEIVVRPRIRDIWKPEKRLFSDCFYGEERIGPVRVFQ